AGFTLYRVGVVKRTPGVVYAAVDGGMSDNPRPQLYGSHYEALLANRADEPVSGIYRIAGKHCESGDVLIDSVDLPEPRRDDLLAVPATGAYTLAMASNYNGVPRPAAVLVADGRAELIRRRESLRAELDPRDLDVGDPRMQGESRDRMHEQRLAERRAGTRLSTEPHRGFHVHERQRHELGEAAARALLLTRTQKMARPVAR